MGKVFLIGGLTLLALTLSFNVWQGNLLAFGRPQFLLLIVSGITLTASSATVRRAVRELLQRSHQRSPGTAATLQRQPSRYIVCALWFACVVSLGEMTYWSYAKEVSNRWVLGYEYMWRIPIGYALIFTGMGLVWFLVGRYRTSHAHLPGLLFVCLFIGTYGLLPLLVKGLYSWSVILVAVGVAVQVARLSRGHSYAWDLLIRRTILPVTASVVVLASGYYLWPKWQERRALAQLAVVSAVKPNVLLVVLDTVRAKSLSLYGYDRATTPNLDRFGSRGVVFERAFSTAPWTLPSHAGMFTARFPHELNASWRRPLDGTYPTIAEALRRHGYATAGFVANYGYAGAFFGLGRGFIRYEGEKTTVATSLLNTSLVATGVHATQVLDSFRTHENLDRKSAERISNDFLTWLDKRDMSHPYFAFLNYFDAHDPYLPPPEFAKRFSSSPMRGFLERKKLDEWSPGEIQRLRDAYDGTLAYVDDQLGRLISGLESRNGLENTVVIITSDHGEQFGEHNLLGHAASLYGTLLHVPLMIVYPQRIAPGMRLRGAVSLHNLPKTILDLAGLPDPFGFPGRSLMSDHLESEGDHLQTDIVLASVERALSDYPDSYPGRKGRMKSLIFEGRHYIKNEGTGQEELYSLDDPDELVDLSEKEPGRLLDLRSQLERLVAARKHSTQ
jgi:arylsulfatase A-like enzyme